MMIKGSLHLRAPIVKHFQAKKIVIVSYPLAFDAPVSGGLRRNINIPYGRTRMVGYPTVKQI